MHFPHLAAAFLLIGSLTASPAGAALSLIVMAKTGDPIPGSTHQYFEFGAPVIRRPNEPVFYARGILNNIIQQSRLVRAGPNPRTTTVIISSGDAAPGGGNIFNMIRSEKLMVDGSGTVSFVNTLGTLFDRLFLGGSPGQPLALVAREGQVVPGQGTLSGFFTIDALNDAGQIAFTARNGGFWRATGASGSLVRVLADGDPAPGGGAFLLGNDPGDAVMNASGTMAMGATTIDGTTILPGIYAAAPQGAITRIVRSGAAAPSGNGVYIQFTVPAINDLGQLAFGAILGDTLGDDDGYALLLGNANQLAEILRSGQSVPGGNGVFAPFPVARLHLNNQGQVLVQSTIAIPDLAFTSGLFLASGSNIEEIARIGEAAPCGGTFVAFGDAQALNDDGLAVFSADVNTGETRKGLFFYRNGVRGCVARTGDSVAGLGTITRIEMAEGAGLGNSMLNESGQVAFLIEYADGSAVGNAITLWNRAAIVFDNGFEEA